jgi:hypothetical protein
MHVYGMIDQSSAYIYNLLDGQTVLLDGAAGWTVATLGATGQLQLPAVSQSVSQAVSFCASRNILLVHRFIDK